MRERERERDIVHHEFRIFALIYLEDFNLLLRYRN